MMKKTILAAFMVLGLSAMISVSAFAKPGQDGMGQEPAAQCQGTGETQGCGCGCGCGAMMGEGQGKGCGMGEGHHKGPHGKKGAHKFWKCPKASAEMGLTNEQKQKLEAMDADAEVKVEAIRGEIKVMKDQMKALFDAEPIDVNAVRTLAGQIAAKKAEKRVLRSVQKAESLNILTTEQRGKLRDFRDGMRDGKGKPGKGRPCKGRK